MSRISRRAVLRVPCGGAVFQGTSGGMANQSQNGESHPMWQQALDYSIGRVRQNLCQLISFPEFTQAGHWQCVEDGGWVGGHWVGLLWLAYAHTRDDALCQAARAWAARLVPRQFDETTHDLGFLFELSHVWGARFTGDTALRSPALNAAQNLARRFNGRGKFIQAWGALDAPPARRGRAIIDTMMNLGLLYWASAQTGDPRYSSIATEHARTALACQVRPDGSTAHVADFDPDSGVFLRQDTYQGQSASSCWSRGQAWSVYGFANCYDKTREAIFLDAARNLADYALRRLPSDYVPYWDYDSPRIPHDVRDSSAAAILAAGLLKLAAVEADATLAERWRTETEHILESLWHHYSSRGTREPSILLHGTRNKPRDFADHGLIYGDYYFVEALTGLTTPERLEM